MEQFDFIKKRFGFGCMRLPMKDNEVDIEECKKMADAFLEAGFNYFDTAHGYIGGKSEKAIKEFLTSRYPREKYSLTDKLTGSFFKKQEDIRPLLLEQLEICGVDYFDFYLMHAQNSREFEKFKSCQAYETAFALKEEGLVRHVGISFHDKADVLDRILTEYPQIEIVQIQFNYLDYDSPSIESRKVYEVCVKHDKPVLVMEPVRGGYLVNLPDKAKQILDDLKGGSYASYALRFVAQFPQIRMILSGMSNLEQMLDNISTMSEPKPFTEEEAKAVQDVVGVYGSLSLIPCTGCRYCVDENHCPKDILIPSIFSAFNNFSIWHDWNSRTYYTSSVSNGHSKASECLKCGMCERVCPQHLPIRQLLEQAAEVFEKEQAR